MKPIKIRALIRIVLTALYFVLINTTGAYAASGTENAGDILQVLIPAAAYTTTFVLDDTAGRIEFYKSFLTTVVTTHTLKFLVNKHRPDNNGDQSFPSGHTSAAFQGATFIHKRYGLKYSVPAYLGAVFVGYSRIEGESDKHYLADVIAGATIGILSSSYFTTPYKGFTITPTVNGGFYGVNLSKRW